MKWNFKDRDRPLDRFRAKNPEVNISCACGEDKDCFGGKTVGNRLYGRREKDGTMTLKCHSVR
jgi:hypothetical protein